MPNFGSTHNVAQILSQLNSKSLIQYHQDTIEHHKTVIDSAMKSLVDSSMQSESQTQQTNSQ